MNISTARPVSLNRKISTSFASSQFPPPFPSTMSKASSSQVASALKKEKITLFLPGELDYDRSVATANLFYRFSRPSLVVAPTTVEQVQTLVKEAKKMKLLITIKNGGHSYAGFSTSDRGILLDLSKMKSVKLDMESRKKTVTLSGGALWGHAYKELVYGRHDGFIINGGRCPSVGVSGFTLGGGLGPFTRSFGMGIDSLLEATIVTADGKVVTVGEKDDPKSKNGELFWALRGGGGGNFGVVVSMKSRVEKLRSKEVVAGRHTWYPESDAKSITEFINTMKNFYTTNWPTEITIDSSWLCELDQTKTPLGARFLVYYNGKKPEFDKLMDKSLPAGLSKQLKRRSMEEKSSRFLYETLVAQWSEEAKRSLPTNKSYSVYSSFVLNNDQKTIESATSIIKSEMEAFRKKFKGEKGLLQVTFIHSGGKASTPKSDDTAFPWREGTYHAYIFIEWFEKWLQVEMTGFCKKFAARLRPFSLSKRAAFINFPDRTFESKTYGRAYYGANYAKLQRVKEAWDKDNYFNFSQSIQAKKKTSPKRGTQSRGATEGGSESDPEESDEEDSDGDSEALPIGRSRGGESIEEIPNAASWVDGLASEQWENFTPPPMEDFLGLSGNPYEIY